MDDGFTIDDLLEIQRRMHEFNARFDTGDADGFADLFTDDALLESATGDCATREERRGKVIDAASRPPHRHFTTNVVIQPDGPGRARARANFIYMESRGGTIETRSTGTYADEWVLHRGEWLIRHRVASSDPV